MSISVTAMAAGDVAVLVVTVKDVAVDTKVADVITTVGIISTTSTIITLTALLPMVYGLESTPIKSGNS